MSQFTINDHRVTLLAAVNANLQALDGKIQELTAQRRQLASAYYAELQKAATENGHELKPGASVRFQGDSIVVSWEEATTEKASENAV